MTRNRVSRKNIYGIILAAGQGTRIEAKDGGQLIPKVMIKLGGRPLVDYCVETMQQAGIGRPILVVGFQQEKVRKFFGSWVDYVEQKEQLGTGHAVATAAKRLADQDGVTVVMYGDMPFFKPATIRRVIAAQIKTAAPVVITIADVPEQFMFGRVVRDRWGKISKIVEAKDCSPAEYKIKETNVSLYAFDNRWLFENLPKIKNQNVKKEYYLTDLIEIAIKQGLVVEGITTPRWQESLGINTWKDYQAAEEELKKRKSK